MLSEAVGAELIVLSFRIGLDVRVGWSTRKCAAGEALQIKNVTTFSEFTFWRHGVYIFLKTSLMNRLQLKRTARFRFVHARLNASEVAAQFHVSRSITLSVANQIKPSGASSTRALISAKTDDW
jgi:hypothetical protein